MGQEGDRRVLDLLLGYSVVVTVLLVVLIVYHYRKQKKNRTELEKVQRELEHAKGMIDWQMWFGFYTR